ncbi:MAG: hemerythrin domain-containing protein [Bacteroidia bacterium]|nr:hemerythrin domain-containing protein [Bacteroidia bacterium]
MNHDPVQYLMDEHDIILKAVNTLKDLIRSQEKDELKGNSLQTLILFFREYADRYHHHKEEELLFPLLGETSPLLEDGILKEMLEQHETMREMMREASAKLHNGDLSGAQQSLAIYSEALLDHIAVENDELFQIAASQLSSSEKEKMYFRFEDIDRELGETQKQDLVRQMELLASAISR